MMRFELGSDALFPDAEGIYLNHAGMSLLNQHAADAMREEMALWTRQSTWAHRREVRHHLRERLAALIGAARPEHIAMVPNTTRAAQFAAWSVSWHPGDAVILVRGAYPANVLPWTAMAEANQLHILWLDAWSPHTHEQWMTTLSGLLRDHPVRLMALSVVPFQTGWRLPLAQISTALHQYDALLYVDAIQACGVVDIDVVTEGVDILGCGGHKWMMGLDGAGFMYIAPHVPWHPRFVGAASVSEGQMYLALGAGHLDYDAPLRQDATALEGGSQNTLGYVAMNASLDILLSWHQQGLAAHLLALHEILYEAILDAAHPQITPLWTEHAAYRGGRFVCRVNDGPLLQSIYQGLLSNGVACAMPDGHLRLSPFGWQSTQQIQQAARVLCDLIVSLR